jgi:hypothetical protein
MGGPLGANPRIEPDQFIQKAARSENRQPQQDQGRANNQPEWSPVPVQADLCCPLPRNYTWVITWVFIGVTANLNYRDVPLGWTGGRRILARSCFR